MEKKKTNHLSSNKVQSELLLHACVRIWEGRHVGLMTPRGIILGICEGVYFKPLFITTDRKTGHP